MQILRFGHVVFPAPLPLLNVTRLGFKALPFKRTETLPSGATCEWTGYRFSIGFNAWGDFVLWINGRDFTLYEKKEAR